MSIKTPPTLNCDGIGKYSSMKRKFQRACVLEHVSFYVENIFFPLKTGCSILLTVSLKCNPVSWFELIGRDTSNVLLVENDYCPPKSDNLFCWSTHPWLCTVTNRGISVFFGKTLSTEIGRWLKGHKGSLCLWQEHNSVSKSKHISPSLPSEIWRIKENMVSSCWAALQNQSQRL